MNRREFVSTVVAASQSSDSMARCRVLDHRGEPLPVEELRRFHICDFLLRPISITPQFAPGEVRFQAPDQPFRIGLTMRAPGFGHLVVYADNRGRGYTSASFADPLFLNYEFAADRLATVHKLAPGPHRRAGQAQALLKKAEAANSNPQAQAAWCAESLSESLWAGEEIVFERAKERIARQGPRPGFLFGCNSFGYPRLGKPYADRFEALFNYATLPFYLGPVQRVQGQPNYGGIEKILSWLDGTPILKKGHPLVWFYPQTTPDWLKNKPYDEVKRLCLDYARQSVRRFRNRIHAWDVINEAHMQNVLGFTIEQQLDITRGAAQAAREADPTCFRVINNCCTWSDYMARQPKLGQQSVYDYLQMVRDARIDFEAIGLQYYYSGRDLLEIERSIETFKDFGKPIHITELGLPSSSEEIKNPYGQNTRFPWHGERWSETAQAGWVAQFYTLCFSKPYIEAVTWWDLNDPAFIPHGGLLRQDLSPKESYSRLQALLREWRQMDA